MSIEAHSPAIWLPPLLASALLALVLPSGARAKFTCEERGRPPDGIALHGLPASPIAGRSYQLVVTLARSDGVNPRPYLGAQHCGNASERETAPGVNGRFWPVGGQGSRMFALDLRFPRPGAWALSFMDLDGSFYDFGLRPVRASLPSMSKAPATARVSGPVAMDWFIGAGAVAILAGLALAAPRRARS
jgi:hypothetical protein